MRRLAFAGVLVAITVALPALAQQPSVLGAWSWQSPGQGGMDQNTTLFQPDGSYVRVSRLATGQTLRYWGQYQVVQTSPTQVTLQSHILGWLPVSTCMQVSGFAPQCQQVPRPPDASFPLAFTSPSTLQAQGVTLHRDSAPYLLQQQVPQQTMTMLNAPVQPSIRQPVMPAMHPYVTPNGPGNRAAAANHAGAQTFINETMRGCYTAADGTLWGCRQ
ncbi:hypothetical protein [Acidisphaera sp. L21]|uniref:hypothetical protein n=1 Tax=Acidisphaera sp. L21 TaxID=1641851 RepID=UPI00131CCBEC|nr:hypothetical protein [Acidisphaera sp. L21]